MFGNESMLSVVASVWTLPYEVFVGAFRRDVSM